MSQGRDNSGRNHRGARAGGGGRFPKGAAFAFGLVAGIGSVVGLMLALGYLPPTPATAPAEHAEGRIVEQPPATPSPAVVPDDIPSAEQPVDLVSQFYPSAAVGDEGWDYHRVLTEDLNGDGREETVHVIANASRYGSRPDDFSWDDGHIWNVYIEDADGRRTDVFRGWVQLGTLRVRSLDPYSDDGTRGLALLLEEGAGIKLYRVVYDAPGELTTTQLAHVLTWNEAQPVR